MSCTVLKAIGLLSSDAGMDKSGRAVSVHRDVEKGSAIDSSSQTLWRRYLGFSPYRSFRAAITDFLAVSRLPADLTDVTEAALAALTATGPVETPTNGCFASAIDPCATGV